MSEKVAPPSHSGFEGVKAASGQLRGTIAAELADDADHLSDASKNLLKFHGSYQQEDRDARKICGLSPMYTQLELLRDHPARLLMHDIAMEPQTQSAVSFASLAIE